MRTKKVFLNMICDIIPYLIIGIVGLIKVRFLIRYIGDVGNGYYQTINQIITYVFLAQIGFGDAVIFSLYKYFSNDDKKMIENEVKKLTYVSSCKINDKGLQIILESNSTSRLVKHLACNNFNIEEIYKERKGLEQRYMELVEGGIR